MEVAQALVYIVIRVPDETLIEYDPLPAMV
jgi:hypothetical protein